MWLKKKKKGKKKACGGEAEDEIRNDAMRKCAIWFSESHYVVVFVC